MSDQNKMNIYSWTIPNPTSENLSHVNAGVVFACSKNEAGRLLSDFGVDTSKITLNWCGSITGHQHMLGENIIQII